MESILIGNGINIANGNAYLNAENVKKRFLEVLKNKYKLFEKCLGVKELSYNIINEILKDNSNVGIEQLSGKLFDYFYKLILKDNKNIDIFGMSPYGDKSLIERISNIQKITIYVYNSKKEEIDEWKKYIPHAIFKDAKEFMSKNKYEVEKFIWKLKI